jgi:hypothetical protein
MSDVARAHEIFAENEAAFAAEAQKREVEALKSEGNRLVVSGTAIGVASVASAVLLGATCPLCIVGVPALIGFGIYQRVRGEMLGRPPATPAEADESKR